MAETYSLKDLVDTTLTVSRTVNVHKGYALSNDVVKYLPGRQFTLWSWINVTYGTPEQNGIYFMFFETPWDFQNGHACYMKMDDFYGTVSSSVKTNEQKAADANDANKSDTDKILESVSKVAMGIGVMWLLASLLKRN